MLAVISAALDSASEYTQPWIWPARESAATDDRAAVLAAVKVLAIATLQMREQGLSLMARLGGATHKIAELQQGLKRCRWRAGGIT